MFPIKSETVALLLHLLLVNCVFHNGRRVPKQVRQNNRMTHVAEMNFNSKNLNDRKQKMAPNEMQKQKRKRNKKVHVKR